MLNVVLDFFKGLTGLQWVLLMSGVALLFPDIKKYLSTVLDNVKIPADTVDVNNVNVDKIKLSTIVTQWETLYDSCLKNGMHDAATKLQEVFPMLINTKV